MTWGIFVIQVAAYLASLFLIYMDARLDSRKISTGTFIDHAGKLIPRGLVMATFLVVAPLTGWSLIAWALLLIGSYWLFFDALLNKFRNLSFWYYGSNNWLDIQINKLPGGPLIAWFIKMNLVIGPLIYLFYWPARDLLGV